MVFSAAANLAALLALLAVPLVAGNFAAYQLGLYLLYGLVAQGIALCWGRAGFLSLGQAVFFGLGAYLGGFALKLCGGSWLVLLPLLAAAAVMPGVLAWAIGRVLFDRQVSSGPYFSVITLALAILAAQLATKWSAVTGGFNGMSGIPGLPGIDSYGALYYVIVGALAVSTAALGYLYRAPFGLLVAAMAQNEERLQFLGVHTGALKATCFGISGVLAGLAGVLYAPQQGLVTPQAVGFVLSTELLIWTAVGGRASLLGPVIGAVFVGYLTAELRDRFAAWELVVALTFIVVVLRLPGGLAGLLGSIPLRRLAAAKAPPAPAGTAAPPRHGDRGPVDVTFEDVGVSTGGVTILNGLSFALRRPGIHCLIGPNGAGKTSAFNVLTGRLPLARGSIRWAGAPLVRIRPYRTVRIGIGRKFQIPSVFAGLTVAENLRLAVWANRLRPRDALLLGPQRWESALAPELREAFPVLADGAAVAGSLSQGQRQMLEFAMTVLTEPRLLLLDEPCAGLSPDESRRMTDAITRFVGRLQAAALVIEHDMSVVERVSDHVLVVHQGSLLSEGPIEAVRRDPAVRAVYAGAAR